MRGSRLRPFLMGLLLILALASAGWTKAQAQSILAGGTIADIRVEGAQRIEPDTVRSYMQIGAGDPFDPIRLDRALKNNEERQAKTI